MIKVDQHIHLESLKPSHAAEVFSIVDSGREELRKWLPWVDASISIKDTISFIEVTNGRQWAIFKQNQIVGLIGVPKTHDSGKTIEIGYWLSPDYWHQGIMRKACIALMDHYYKNGVESSTLLISTENIPSQKLAKSIGFKETGIIENGENLLGKNYDQIVYQLPKKDFYLSRAIKTSLDTESSTLKVSF